MATFIKQGIAYERIDNIHKDLVGVSIKLHLQNSIINITNLYIPPNSALAKYDLITPPTQTQNCIIRGDLNAKCTLWGSPKNDCQGTRVDEIINKFVVLNDGTGTRITND